MKVLAVTFARSLDDINPEVLEALDNQDYEDYEVLVHTQKSILFNTDPHKNKSLNAAHHRNVIKKMILNTDFDWFLWVDSDIVIPKNAITDLISAKKDLIAGWCKKTRNDDWVAGQWDNEGRMVYYKEPQPGILRVDLMTLGAFLVNKDVMEKIDWRGGVDEYMVDSIGNKYYLGNSLAYSLDAKELGVDSYMAGSVVCEHLERIKGY